MRVPGRLAIPVVVVLLALAAWWAWSAREARSQQRAIAALVTEASAEMRNWLEATPTQEHVIAAESRLEALADMRTSQREEFARAAELYLVGARALAQRQVDAARLAAQAQASERALAAHMAGAARRSPGWIREATELRRRMSEAYGDLYRTEEAVAEIAASMPEAASRLAPYMPRSSILGESAFRAAQKRAEARAEAARAKQQSGGS